MPTTPDSSILALDVGQKRIGLALANRVARIAAPLPALANDENLTANLSLVVENNAVDTLVVGLPRGLNGQSTSQTGYVEAFARDVQAALGLPVHLQDEALTSAKAEAELQGRGKTYTKEDIDSLSAVYILEDYLQGEKG